MAGVTSPHSCLDLPRPADGLADRLLIVRGRAYDALPTWAAWFVRLGAEVAAIAADATVVVSVPVRYYAAALAAAGAVARPRPAPTPESHLAKLEALPLGAYVTWRSGEHLYCGRYGGTETCNGKTHIVINNNGFYKREWDRATDIQPLPEGAEPFKTRRPLTQARGFVTAATGIDADAYVTQIGLRCVLVGMRSQLESELNSQEFAATGGSGDNVHRGSLQELVRCRGLSVATAYRYLAEVLPVYSDPASAAPHAPLVILDGSMAALRWRVRFRGVARLAIIDRLSRWAHDAAGAFAAERAKSGRDIPLEAAACVPPGIEILGFEGNA